MTHLQSAAVIYGSFCCSNVIVLFERVACVGVQRTAYVKVWVERMSHKSIGYVQSVSVTILHVGRGVCRPNSVYRIWQLAFIRTIAIVHLRKNCTTTNWARVKPLVLLEERKMGQSSQMWFYWTSQHDSPVWWQDINRTTAMIATGAQLWSRINNNNNNNKASTAIEVRHIAL